MEFFSDLVQVLGVPRSVGQIYGLLFASKEALSFTDIFKKLNISKGSASQGLRLLRALGAVKAADAADGVRREHFVPELGLRRLVAGVLREKVEPVLISGGSRMSRLRECMLDTSDPELTKFFSQRIDQLDTWGRQVRMLLPVLKTLLDSGHA